MARFKVLTPAEAVHYVDGFDRDELLDSLEDYDMDFRLILVDTKDKTIVYTDGGEPEDMTLDRELRVLVDKLNEVANGD